MASTSLLLSRIIGTNQIPSPEQRSLILDALVEPGRILQQTQADIAEVEKQLESLVQRKKGLVQEMTPYQALVSPFRRLPDDIISGIFLASLPMQHNPVIDARQPPLLLTHISSHTRQVAISTPQLWAGIHVSVVVPCLTDWFDGRNKSRVGAAKRTMVKRTNAIKEWLGRSGACTLAISIHEAGVDTADVFVQDIFEAIIQLAPRWKSISLSCSAYSIQCFCEMFSQSCTEPNLPSLKHLKLDILHAYDQQDDPRATFNYSSRLLLSNLSSVQLVVPAGNYEGYHIQWSHLIHLSLGNALHPASLTSISNVLKLCKSLANCRLHIGVDNADLQLCLPNLKAITLSFDQEAWFTNISKDPRGFSIFDGMELPLLERITYDASVDFLPLLGLIHRMGDRITHLSVANLDVAAELIECLKFCPNLIGLGVNNPERIPSSIIRGTQWRRPAPWANSLRLWATAGDQLLRYLMTAGDVDEMVPEQLCPQLKYLTYHVVDGAISCDMVSLFIRSQCTNEEKTTGLKGLSLTISGGDPDIVRVRHSVEDVLLAGLDLHLMPAIVAPTRFLSEVGVLLETRPVWCVWDNEV